MNATLPFLNRNVSFAREIKEKVGKAVVILIGEGV
mgnify:CR=1 FL=1|jgi:hypothetical protein